MIHLDTNAVIAILNRQPSPVRERMSLALDAGVPVGVSNLVLFELWYGAAKSIRPEGNSRRILDFLAGPVRVVDFDADDAREAGDIRAALERAGTPIAPYDVLIAAQARRRNARLVTTNTREFARVPDLRVEDWAV